MYMYVYSRITLLSVSYLIIDTGETVNAALMFVTRYIKSVIDLGQITVSLLINVCVDSFQNNVVSFLRKLI